MSILRFAEAGPVETMSKTHPPVHPMTEGLCIAWKHYRQLFGVPPYGTDQQISALLDLFPKEKDPCAPKPGAKKCGDCDEDGMVIGINKDGDYHKLPCQKCRGAVNVDHTSYGNAGVHTMRVGLEKKHRHVRRLLSLLKRAQVEFQSAKNLAEYRKIVMLLSSAQRRKKR